MFQLEAQGSAAAMSTAVSAMTSGAGTSIDTALLARVQTLAQGILTDLQNAGLVSPAASQFHVIVSGSGGNRFGQVSVFIEGVHLDPNSKIAVPPQKGF